MRAANTLTVALTWISLIMRFIQLASIYTQHEGIAKGAYSVATICIVMMLLAEMVKGSADIIHEMTPTQDQMNDINTDIFLPNYKAPRANQKHSNP